MATTEEQRSSRRQESSHAEPIDRISDLPDSIICHILSFLPTKSSVATTVLAKRWRYLWSYVPTLYFDCQNQEIIYRVMLQTRVHTLSTIRVRYKTHCSSYQLETWITFATMRNVQKLDIWLRDQDYSHQGDLPRCLFTCKTLVYLSLNACGAIPRSGAVCLPRLKNLHLICVQYEADESLSHLLSGCPVLEELEIELRRGSMVYCNVSSPTVKRLTVNFSIYVGSGGRTEKLEINTPALEYLNINEFFFDEINIRCGVLTSLVEAEINLDSHDDEILHFRSLLGFFDKLCNVKCLALDLSYCSQIVDPVPCAWTTRFRNLTQLKLRADCRFLSKFLKTADNLEILIFYECCRSNMKCCEEIQGRRKPPQQVPTCVLSRLRIVKFAYLEGKIKHEHEIIRYLLSNARVLERMEIAYEEIPDYKAKVDVLEEISRFQRESTSCEVVFVHWFY